MQNNKSDVLIIGAGGAGLVAALHAHENGMKVRVLTKEYPTRSQTCMAQGGINAALGNAGEDATESHVQNTLKSANGLASEVEIRRLCENAPEAVAWLDSIGVCFSRTKDSKIAQRALGGASASRACYAQDYTGLKILHTLYDRCLACGIEILNEKFLLEVLKNGNKACGVEVLDIRSGVKEVYSAKAVILATGGYSRVYAKNSTNATASTGDGIAIALKAGAKVSDMEFVQFHPTGLKSSSILISESARGAGGYLLNSKGERFIDELKPRDIVSRAINDEMLKGEEIFLDIRHLGEAFIDAQLPQERKLAKLYENVDPVHDLIPVKAVAHYTMGGIDVNDTTSTCVDGLFACGECANHSVHGANRLGGNSLLELVVFGKLAGESAALYAQDKSYLHVEVMSKEEATKEIQVDFYKVREELGELFYKDVGIVRDKKTLEKTLEKVNSFLEQTSQMGVKDTSHVYNTNRIEFLEFQNTLAVSKMILLGAIARDESRGAHFRSDKPQKDENYSKHTLQDLQGVL
ncbi:FAD-dependent oxidoreductase [Sulfurimonas sp. SAG-AH-194-I05]|nr:FAD-dependent oxidoreductase [Sulfurimonas sp. SAG-AH-194-I05]MDF1875377.1 FAD-dependent oxidoreductase [Sulfurimonas sp. SAG-AH-194-I05]